MPCAARCSEIVPLLLAHGETENKDTWDFVFRAFREAYGETLLLKQPLGVLSDRHPGLLSSVQSIFGDLDNIHQLVCVHHMKVSGRQRL
jgi:hypothetical protein